MLKLHSADRSVGVVRLDKNNIESYFDFSGLSDEGSIEILIDAFEKDIIHWGTNAVKVLNRSKSEAACSLVEEFDKLYKNFLLKIKDDEEELKEYRVIKMTTGNFYTVKETIEELDRQIEDEEYNERYGFN